MSHHSEQEDQPQQELPQPPQPTLEESLSKPLILNPSTHTSPSILSEPSSIPPNAAALAKSRKRMKCLQIASFVCLLISAVIALAVPPLLHSIIIQKAIDQTTLKPENQGTWAHFPGDTQTIITRNFTFFTLENTMNFLFANEKPRFQETTNFKIQQYEDFLDIKYLQDGNKVSVKDRIWYKEWHEGRSIDEKVKILNMGSIGYWATLKVARPTLLLQQGLALLFTSLEQSIMPTLLGQGLQQQFLQNISAMQAGLLAPSGLPANSTSFFWNDPLFGMSDKGNLGQWATAAIETYQAGEEFAYLSMGAVELMDYFGVSYGQMSTMMAKVYGWVQSLRELLLANHYCEEVELQQCTGRWLGVAQMAESWATGNPPPVAGIIPNDTICDDNITCSGKYPQPNAFIKNVLTVEKGQEQWLSQTPSNYTFSREVMMRWFNYNHSIEEGLNYNTAQDCLLHIGNLDQLWQWGSNFDLDHDEMWIRKIAMRFGLDEDATGGLILWKWLKYMIDEFVKQKGSNVQLGVANLFTQGFYQEFSTLKDHLQPFLLTKHLSKSLNLMTCKQFFTASMDLPDQPVLVTALCQHFDNYGEESFAEEMIKVCQFQGGKSWKELQALGVSSLHLQNHCDVEEEGTVGQILYTFRQQLDKHYNCSMTPNPVCSNYQLALKQWLHSTVTLHPPPSLSDDLQPSLTYADWNPSANQFQYQYFIAQMPQQMRSHFPKYSETQMVPRLTFEQWFSTNGNLGRIIKKEWDSYFFKYMRYVCIMSTMMGFNTRQTVRGYLFGYEDPFLAAVKNQYPPFGGDPSAPSIVNFNDLNLTEEETTLRVIWKTGKDDFKQAGKYDLINGYDYLVNNYSWFDGNHTRWGWKTPWKVNDKFYGTNGKLFGPNQFQADNLTLLIPQVQRYGCNCFHNQTEPYERYGMQLRISYLNGRLGEVSDQNDKYYQTYPNVFNVSSIYGIPLYVTKNHFMNCTEWLEKVDIRIGQSEQFYSEVSRWDDTFAIVQPYTGVSFQSHIYLQNNYLHTPDLLFDYPTPTLLPIFSINRSGNLTESKFHELYDPLVTGLAAQTGFRIAGIILFAIMLALFGFTTYRKRRIDKQLPRKSVGEASKKKETKESLLQDQN